MSFEYRNFPDITGMCALCRRDDGGAPYLHLLSIATEGEYTPAICNRCVQHMFENWPNKPAPKETVVVREPSDEEIGAWVRNKLGVFPLMVHPPTKAKPGDVDYVDAADNARRAATPNTDTVEQQQRKARKRAQGTD